MGRLALGERFFLTGSRSDRPSQQHTTHRKHFERPCDLYHFFVPTLVALPRRLLRYMRYVPIDAVLVSPSRRTQLYSVPRVVEGPDNVKGAGCLMLMR